MFRRDIPIKNSAGMFRIPHTESRFLGIPIFGAEIKNEIFWYFSFKQYFALNFVNFSFLICFLFLYLALFF